MCDVPFAMQLWWLTKETDGRTAAEVAVWLRRGNKSDVEHAKRLVKKHKQNVLCCILHERWKKRSPDKFTRTTGKKKMGNLSSRLNSLQGNFEQQSKRGIVECCYPECFRLKPVYLGDDGKHTLDELDHSHPMRQTPWALYNQQQFYNNWNEWKEARSLYSRLKTCDPECFVMDLTVLNEYLLCGRCRRARYCCHACQLLHVDDLRESCKMAAAGLI